MKEENKRKRNGSRRLERKEKGSTYSDVKVGRKKYGKTVLI